VIHLPRFLIIKTPWLSGELAIGYYGNFTSFSAKFKPVELFLCLTFKAIIPLKTDLVSLPIS
jgi:hypothetical protein